MKKAVFVSGAIVVQIGAMFYLRPANLRDFLLVFVTAATSAFANLPAD